jgi:hypothetical protein
VWLKNAVTQGVFRGNLPYFINYPAEVQARQLALVLGHKYNTLRIIVPRDYSNTDEHLNSLIKAAYWLGRETGFEVLLFLPDLLKESQALNSLKEKPREFIDFSPVISPLMPDDSPYRGEGDSDLEEFSYGPVPGGDVEFIPLPFVLKEGEPNADSPGELILYNYLSKSSELSTLFAFNMPIVTYNGIKYVADILWEEGKLVIEVDGYHFHGSHAAFEYDRHRDYLLMLSSYRVLRLTHSEIIRSVDTAGQKILNVVRYINQTQP